MTELLETIIIFLFLEGFFSGNETGFVSVPISYLKALSHKHASARYVLRFLNKPERFFSTTLLGTNISQITIATLMTHYIYGTLGPNYSPLATVITTPLVWIFAEIVPKTIYRLYAKRIVLITVYPMKFFYYLFYPISTIFSMIARIFLRFLGVKNQNRPVKSFSELIAVVREYIPQKYNEFFTNLLDFNTMRVDEILIPWNKVVRIEEDITVAEARQLFSRVRLYRVPVILDKNAYVLTLFDLIGRSDDERISRIIHPVISVAPTAKIITVLERLQKGRQLIAVVRRGHKCVGIVTLEQIMNSLLPQSEARV